MVKRKASRKKPQRKSGKPAKRKTISKGKTALIAFGGNALIRPGQRGTFGEQLSNIQRAVEHMVRMASNGWKIVITHGNGPQVGFILLQQERTWIPKMPLHACVAETQALIGYMIQEAFYNALHKRGLHVPVVTLVTQVIVNKGDPAFQCPTKPIGPFYDHEEELPIEWHVVESPKGVRRVVASPEPKRIVEADAIKELSERAIVIACGGGGIPVMKRGNTLMGVNAVIDKDLAGQLLAETVDADLFAILTDVPNVCVNHGKKSERKLSKVSLMEVKKHVLAHQFPPGTMGPKIDAAVKFLEGRKGRSVIITSLDLFEKAMKGKAGTIIRKS